MSYERGLQSLNLEMPDRIPHTEYVSNPRLIERVTGINPEEEGRGGDAMKVFMEITDYDFLWYNDSPEFKGRQSWMGSARYSEDQELRPPSYAFKDVAEVMAFDPIEEFGIKDVDETAEFLEERWRARQENLPTLVVPGGFYNTVFTWCIKTFGWDLFMIAAALDYESFDRILEGFYHVSFPIYQAWAKTPIKAFICHDDIVWTAGPVFHPDWYRKYIFPRYKKLWMPLKERGIKVLFCSDGDFTIFIDDLVEVGADGFIFEPLVDLNYVAEKYGKSKVIIGNIDCRILTFGTKEDIRADVERCAAIGRSCPGYFFAVGNHIPYNVPVENALYYFDCIRELGKR